MNFYGNRQAEAGRVNDAASEMMRKWMGSTTASEGVLPMTGVQDRLGQQANWGQNMMGVQYDWNSILRARAMENWERQKKALKEQQITGAIMDVLGIAASVSPEKFALSGAMKQTPTDPYATMNEYLKNYPIWREFQNWYNQQSQGNPQFYGGRKTLSSLQ